MDKQTYRGTESRPKLVTKLNNGEMMKRFGRFYLTGLCGVFNAQPDTIYRSFWRRHLRAILQFSRKICQFL